jgi:hypothetical protein
MKNKLSKFQKLTKFVKISNTKILNIFKILKFQNLQNLQMTKIVKFSKIHGWSKFQKLSKFWIHLKILNEIYYHFYYWWFFIFEYFCNMYASILKMIRMQTDWIYMIFESKLFQKMPSTQKWGYIPNLKRFFLCAKVFGWKKSMGNIIVHWEKAWKS